MTQCLLSKSTNILYNISPVTFNLFCIVRSTQSELSLKMKKLEWYQNKTEPVLNLKVGPEAGGELIKMFEVSYLCHFNEA